MTLEVYTHFGNVIQSCVTPKQLGITTRWLRNYFAKRDIKTVFKYPNYPYSLYILVEAQRNRL